MTKFSKQTDEEINIAIFNAKGWKQLLPPAMPSWQRPTKQGTEYWYFAFPPDYTHDWRLCGELIEEMGNAISNGWEYACGHSDIDGTDSLQWRVWMTRFTNNRHDYRNICGEADAFLRANCLAWLAWDESK